ncbi:peroxisomal adenine nucleotide carrier [Klebsormidium nitens]|uniref:Peroxisomal adenine nucleotide carrier n=1 Tax=Klebsormidium nitens TaxID=105231 RepID=A0A1Y1HQM1_KLENI|nr:peroxisomal adenine nucleotide carrier [Klebsormidium nitens]|eukprot:GAQ78886.1 peroxisomal adenine nucleotide carrier [Klebsormidium nitens]
MANFDSKALQEATAGAVGSLLSTTLLYPLDTCKTRYQADNRQGVHKRYTSTLDVFHQALRNKQLGSLYQGLGTKNFQSVLAGFVYFYSYQYLKDWYIKRTGIKRMGMGANLLIAAAAGAINSIVIQPLDTASSRMQTMEAGKVRGFWTTLTKQSLGEAYDGLGASLILTSNPAIQYTVFEQLRNAVLAVETRLYDASRTAAMESKAAKGEAWTRRDELPAPALTAAMAFVIGALSKTVATVVTYPAIRAKVMLQADKDEEGGHPRNMLDAMRRAVDEGGFKGLYKGMNAQIFKTVLSAALMLMIKEKVSQGTVLAFLLLRKWGKVARERNKLLPLELKMTKIR